MMYQSKHTTLATVKKKKEKKKKKKSFPSLDLFTWYAISPIVDDLCFLIGKLYLHLVGLEFPISPSNQLIYGRNFY